MKMFQMKRALVLASKSARRQEILKMLELPFTIDVQHTDEPIRQRGEKLSHYVERLARYKGLPVAEAHRQACVVAADTIVTKDNQIFSKPKNEEEAYQHLKALSGTTHDVYTGVAIFIEGQITTFSEKTRVTFHSLDDVLIRRYIQTNDPYDKAGAYGIQTLGAIFVKEIEGDFWNVVGFPASRFIQTLRQLNEVTID